MICEKLGMPAVRRLKRAFERERKRRRGFTLIELLIVVAIIAILAAIAIPQFASYRRRGYNASAHADCRNIRTTEEAMFADTQDYGVSQPGSSTVTPENVGVQIGPGGTVRLVGGLSSTPAQKVSLSPNVYAIAEAGPSGDAHTSFLTKTGHATGDQYYGVESDNTMMYRMGYSTSGVWTRDLDVIAPVAATSGKDFIGVGNWMQM